MSKKSTKLIFASSAAVYGKVSNQKINESKTCQPVNYYGLSKYACENIIKYQLGNKKRQYAILRYLMLLDQFYLSRFRKILETCLILLVIILKKKSIKLM